MLTRTMACAPVLGVLALCPPATAAPPVVHATELAPVIAEAVQHARSRAFHRCMVRHYGPRYFARVPRAHRWHMAQVCMS